MIIGLIRTTVLSSLVFIMAFSLSSCSKKTAPSTGNNNTPVVSPGVSIPGAPCIVYKTRADYSRQVPVALSEDKTRITSFPDVADIYAQGKLAYPTSLSQGYLLDNRGIGADVAFLKLTYEDYRAFDETPPVADLFAALLETDPLIEMYQCGYRNDYTDIITELNRMIETGKLSGCKKMK